MGNNPSISLDKQSEYERGICTKVEEVIKSWKNQILTYNDLIITPFKIEKDKKKQSVILPKFLYVHLVSIAIQQVIEYDISYIDSIYKLAKCDISCTGAISVKTFEDDQKNIFLSFKKDLNVHVMDKSLETVRKNFITPFMEKFDQLDGKCPFISLAVNFEIVATEDPSCHANIVLISKNQKHIKFLIYEPHGADGNKSKHQRQLIDMQNRFSTFLIELFTEKGFTSQRIPSVLVSCPIGIQVYMKDKLGYCAPISSLWIYIVLMITKKFNATDNFKFFPNLDIIEKCIYRLNDNNPEKVYDMVVNFTRYFIENFYSNYMIPDCNEKRKIRPLLIANVKDPGFSKTNFERFVAYFKKEFDTLDKSRYPQIITIPTDTDDFVCPLSSEIHISVEISEQHRSTRRKTGPIEKDL